jgi:hypothetical protein
MLLGALTGLLDRYHAIVDAFGYFFARQAVQALIPIVTLTGFDILDYSTVKCSLAACLLDVAAVVDTHRFWVAGYRASQNDADYGDYQPGPCGVD